MLLICQQRFLFNVFYVFYYFHKNAFLTFFIFGVNVFYIYSLETSISYNNIITIEEPDRKVLTITAGVFERCHRTENELLTMAHGAWVYLVHVELDSNSSDRWSTLGSSISGPRAKSGPRRPNNWPAEQRQNGEEIYYIFLKIHLPVLTIYIFLFIVNERLILVKFISVMSDAV